MSSPGPISQTVYNRFSAYGPLQWRGVSTRRSRLVISACADSVSTFTSTDTPSNMAEAAVDPADSFMLGWLTLASAEESSPIVMANRMVELLCWYIIQQLLAAMAGFAESPADKQLNWRAVLTGWSVSIRPEHLSGINTRLLKLVALAEAVRACLKGEATSKTYEDIGTLLPFLADPADSASERSLLVGEANILQQRMIMSLKSERVKKFAQNAGRIIVRLIRSKFEIPQMFEPRIRDLLQSMEAVLQEDDLEEAMGEDHCHHGPSLVAYSPSDGSTSVSQPVDTGSVTAGLQDLQLGHDGEQQKTQLQATRPITSEGRRKQLMWTMEEIECVKDGMKRFGGGPNKWKTIKENYPVLKNRTKEDIRNKWRRDITKKM